MYSHTCTFLLVLSSYPLAVVSLNDSEELSSAVSEEEEDEEEEESDQAEEEEEDDSGSEVEIIEEVQGNGRLPPLQPTSIFVPQGQTHFLPSLSEQEAAEFSLMTPDAETKVTDIKLKRLRSSFIKKEKCQTFSDSSFFNVKTATFICFAL